ncbi:hypothetical protein C0J52_21919 [Blattella germanica]|nr:hypothetical protein C0J52_21919 [Blattella germanica]
MRSVKQCNVHSEDSMNKNLVAFVNEKLPVNQRCQMNLLRELGKHSSIDHKNQQLVADWTWHTATKCVENFATMLKVQTLSYTAPAIFEGKRLQPAPEILYHNA